MTSVKILVAHHKPGIVIESDMYLPVHVGKALSNYKLNMQGDDTGDNISKLNPILCEMTAVYWAWKNVNADYIGLCHYRRYFTFLNKSIGERIIDKLKYLLIRTFGNLFRPGVNFSYTRQVCISDDDLLKENSLLFENRIRKYVELNEVDYVAPSPYYNSCYNNEMFFSVLGRDHIQRLREIIRADMPDFYKYIEATLKSNLLYAANMCILRKELFNDYCKIVFSVLEKHYERTIHEKWCDDPLKERCYARVSGYLAEIITSAFVLKMIKEKKKGIIVNTMFLNK